MNRLMERGLLQEISCGGNFAYVLADAGLFQTTDYKVLHSQTESGFVRCTKMLFNGKIQLYYMPDSMMKPLSAVLPTLNPETFLTVVSNLLQGVLETKNNGFLSCTNVELSFDKIFVDVSNLKVYLVYLPVSEHLVSDDILFESQLRAELMRTIRTMPALAGPKTTALAGNLMDGTLSVEELCARMKTPVAAKGWKKPEHQAEVDTTPEEPEIPEPPKKPKVVRLVAMNAPKRVEFTVNKSHYLIGKTGAIVHAEIDFNRMISRTHCCVDKDGDEYVVMDLGSTNGTFLNGDKLQPNHPKKLKDGDMLRLANSIFQVVIR